MNTSENAQTSEHFVAMVMMRAVPGIHRRADLDLWALDPVEPDVIRDLLDGEDGIGGTYWDERVVIYRESDGLIISVRADGVNPQIVVDGLTKWSRAIAPPFAPMSDVPDGVELALFGPHPIDGITEIFLSFTSDPDNLDDIEAYATVAWVKWEDE